MPQELMLDPSLLLSTRTFGLVAEGWKRGELAGAVLPASFVVAASARELDERTLALFGGTRNLPDLETVGRFVSESRLMPEWTQLEASSISGEFIARLAGVARDELALRILIEEWVFLNSHSWIASRSKRAFAAFLRAGAVAVEWGGKRIDEVTARTLRLPADEVPLALRPGQRVRAAAKWVAVGGISVTSLMQPITATLVNAGLGIFFLLDP